MVRVESKQGIIEGNKAIQAGRFFCHACCEDKLAKEENKEHKGYCNFCVEVLNKEHYFQNKEEKRVKKVDAMNFIQANSNATIENKDGHYGVIVAGKKVFKAEDLPQTDVQLPEAIATDGSIAVEPKKKGRQVFAVKDLKTGQVYPGMEAAKVANKIHIKLFDVKLDDGQPRFVKA